MLQLYEEIKIEDDQSKNTLADLIGSWKKLCSSEDQVQLGIKKNNVIGRLDSWIEDLFPEVAGFEVVGRSIPYFNEDWLLFERKVVSPLLDDEGFHPCFDEYFRIATDGSYVAYSDGMELDLLSNCE